MAELNVAKMVLADVAPPADAVTIHGWMEWGDGVYQRLFTSWSREVGEGGSVAVCGFQFNDGRVERLIAYTEGDESLTAEQARQLAATLVEVARVHTADLTESFGGAQLLVHGKGGKQRVVPVAEDLAALIRLGAAGHTPGAPATGWLFADGTGDHLTPSWVGLLVSRALPDGYTMHALRHRFASRAYRGTRNLRAVQQLLGHESIGTTERYTAVDDDEMRAAAACAWGDR
ncbi:tyrosine-type recombinase/integrase [Mycobacterium simiae]|uniref:Tyrosine-type recombinase/integrase n=2 Tax=Mycobacterium simiae TaxID=1784 RepID=A0A5B1BI86_MYCSI|nr:tyrosine-type recombinase/integrase [Mycobacterium simiae]